jgi:hypothetical protein
VSHVDAGKANIEDEILSEDNQQFVLHDSRGFEAGEEGNLKIVTDFIDKRNGMPDIKTSYMPFGMLLHSVAATSGFIMTFRSRLCFAIPSAGGRIFETGVEEFLKLKVAGKLGTSTCITIFELYKAIRLVKQLTLVIVPIIAIFTKYDELITHADFQMDAISSPEVRRRANI